MEKYEPAELEIIFYAEDVVTASEGGDTDTTGF